MSRQTRDDRVYLTHIHERVWETITGDLPALGQQIAAMLAPKASDGG